MGVLKPAHTHFTYLMYICNKASMPACLHVAMMPTRSHTTYLCDSLITYYHSPSTQYDSKAWVHKPYVGCLPECMTMSSLIHKFVFGGHTSIAGVSAWSLNYSHKPVPNSLKTVSYLAFISPFISDFRIEGGVGGGGQRYMHNKGWDLLWASLISEKGVCNYMYWAHSGGLLQSEMCWPVMQYCVL